MLKYLSISESKECPESRFRCLNGQCIWYHFRCDGNVDCWDATDEASCGRLKLMNFVLIKSTVSMLQNNCAVAP